MPKIMLVEDDNNLREIYGERLMAEGYDIVSASDGEEALTLAINEKPDLIISDVMMPKISGFDMLDILRQTPETKNTKIIMMTALSQTEDKERADRLGADKYLVKSQVTLEDVARVVHDLVYEAEQPSADETANAQPANTVNDTVSTVPVFSTELSQPTPVPSPAQPSPVPQSDLPNPTPQTVPEPVSAPVPQPVVSAPVPEPAVVTPPSIVQPEPVAVPDPQQPALVEESNAVPMPPLPVAPGPVSQTFSTPSVQPEQNLPTSPIAPTATTNSSQFIPTNDNTSQVNNPSAQAVPEPVSAPVPQPVVSTPAPEPTVVTPPVAVQQPEPVTVPEPQQPAVAMENNAPTESTQNTPINPITGEPTQNNTFDIPTVVSSADAQTSSDELNQIEKQLADFTEQPQAEPVAKHQEPLVEPSEQDLIHAQNQTEEPDVISSDLANNSSTTTVTEKDNPVDKTIPQIMPNTPDEDLEAPGARKKVIEPLSNGGTAAPSIYELYEKEMAQEAANMAVQNPEVGSSISSATNNPITTNSEVTTAPLETVDFNQIDGTSSSDANIESAPAKPVPPALPEQPKPSETPANGPNDPNSIAL